MLWFRYLDIDLQPKSGPVPVLDRDVTDSESAAESDEIRQFFRNSKSDGYLKSDRDGFKILVSVQLKCYFRK